MNQSRFLIIVTCKVLRVRTALQTTRNINITFGFNITTQQIETNWFAKFRTGKFHVTNEIRRCPKSMINNEEHH